MWFPYSKCIFTCLGKFHVIKCTKDIYLYLYRERNACPSPEVEISVVDQSESNPYTDQNSVCSDRPASARPPAPTPNTARSGKVMSPLPEEEGARWVTCLNVHFKNWYYLIMLNYFRILFRLVVKCINWKVWWSWSFLWEY